MGRAPAHVAAPVPGTERALRAARRSRLPPAAPPYPWWPFAPAPPPKRPPSPCSSVPAGQAAPRRGARPGVARPAARLPLPPRAACPLLAALATPPRLRPRAARNRKRTDPPPSADACSAPNPDTETAAAAAAPPAGPKEAATAAGRRRRRRRCRCHRRCPTHRPCQPAAVRPRALQHRRPTGRTPPATATQPPSAAPAHAAPAPSRLLLRIWLRLSLAPLHLTTPLRPLFEPRTPAPSAGSPGPPPTRSHPSYWPRCCPLPPSLLARGLRLPKHSTLLFVAASHS